MANLKLLDAMAAGRLLSKQEVAHILNLHPVSLMRLVRAGDFPKPIRFGDKVGCVLRFDPAEVQTWLESRKQARAA